MYDYFNQFYSYVEDNPEWQDPTTASVYFSILHIANRLRWKDRFAIIASEIMFFAGISSRATYYKSISKLIDAGFIQEVTTPKNQYQNKVIAVLKFEQARLQPREQPPIQATIQPHVQAREHIIRHKDKEDSKDNKDKIIHNFKSWNSDQLKDSIVPYVAEFGRDLCRQFFDYWSEPLPSGKMRMTAEKAWDVKRRLGTFKRNQKVTPQAAQTATSQYRTLA